MLNLLPYALAAYGGYKGYQGAKDAGASGLGRIFGGVTGAAAGYYGGKTLVNMPMVQSAFPSAAKFTPFTQTQAASLLGLGQTPTPAVNPKFLGTDKATGGAMVPNPNYVAPTESGGSLLDILRKEPGGKYDPLKLSLAAGGIPLALGAFNQGPADIYMPGYNMSYLKLKEERGNYKYIDPATGQEKEYESVYAPEEQGLGERRMGPYSLDVQRLNTGGLATINKFNEGGVNYLPSKISHDENDSTNYVRASGYVEDGSGAGDKDEDTMLAQLADGEFVTRADGVLGAGIIAGANPNSIKDMREKGAEYFYEQQKRYKRVFDLLKESNGYSKQKEN
jgi:hypothetical protein